MEHDKSTNAGQKNAKITTIKLSKATKQRLDHLRVYKRETYDEIIEKMLSIMNLSKVSPERARIRLIMIDKEKKRNNRHKLGEESI